MHFNCLISSYRVQLTLEKITSMGVAVRHPFDEGDVACFYLSCFESHIT